jgi:spore maturation protein CgeB
MQILIVGTDTPGALERYCAAALRSLGHEVSYHDLHNELIRYCRFRQTPVLSDIEQAALRGRFNRRLIQAVERGRPDLVLVFKGVELAATTLERLRALPGRPVLANWNPDNPFDFPTANTNRQVIASIPAYDVYFIWDKDLFVPLREAGARQVAYLPFGYDPAHHHPVRLTEEARTDLYSEVCFVGGYTPERAALLRRLSEHKIRLWGTGWERLPSDSALRPYLQGGWTWGEEMARAFGATEIVLNEIRAQNGQAHNMRTFEAPACGAFMLSTRTRDQVGWLPEGVGAGYYQDMDELAEKVAYYLESPGERMRIAAEGHRLIVEGKHTYHDRMRELIETLEHLHPPKAEG